ncbi:MAG: hemerythrin family protein [Rhodospirillales bacterium]|nr:hemerythrin family protein [Rhodospirillales bacterium]
MDPVVWQESWSVGNDSLDDDHKRLVSIINRVSDSMSDGQDPVWLLNDLKSYAKYHFDREEALMEAAEIEGLVEHKETHRMFVEWLTTLQATINLPEARFILLEAANEYLRDWLGRHILGTDMQYKGRI